MPATEQIRVDPEVKQALIKRGTGIHDSFNKVLRRLLGLDKPKRSEKPNGMNTSS